MGQMKQQLIEDMNIHEVKDLLNNFNSDRDNGYIKFLEQQLEVAEDKVQVLLRKLGPGKCVECFKTIPQEEIICGPCQDECDGRWDHLRVNNKEKESH